MTEKYTIHINKMEKKVEVAILGYIDEETAYAFIKEYQEKAATIKTAKYTLLLDCRKMEFLPEISAVLLKDVYQLYKEDNYAKVIFIMKLLGNTMLNMQIMQVAREAKFTSYEIQMD